MLDNEVSQLLQQAEKITAKTAFTETGVIDAARAAVSDHLRSQALSNLSRTLLVGLGAGAALRGVKGLANLSGPKLTANTMSPAFVQVPYPEKDEKQASLGNFLSGDSASSVWGIPWFMPAVTAAGLGGTLGGYSLMNRLINKRRETDRKSEQSDAVQEFEQAMLDQQAAPNSIKAALDQTLANLKASADWGELAGRATGGAGVLGLALAGAGAYAGYSIGKSRQKRRILESALKQRLRSRFQASPPEMIAVPVPVSTKPKPPTNVLDAKKLIAQPGDNLISSST